MPDDVAPHETGGSSKDRELVLRRALEHQSLTPRVLLCVFAS